MSIQADPKTQILQEARKQFFAHGYSKVLMADLARQLGMSKKTLYQYFRGKEELLTAMLKEYLGELKREVEEILQQDDLEFIQKASQAFGIVGTKFSPINSQLITDIKKNAPSSWLLLQQYKTDAAFLRFNALLKEGIAKGHIRKDVNRPLAVMLYASALETILDPDFIRQVPPELMQELNYTPAAVYEGLVHLILNGILEKE
jgi:AcrR family transcriptional regulator